MNQIDTKQYFLAKDVLVKLTEERAGIIEARRLKDGEINGNYNSQFWDEVSNFDPELHEQLKAEYARLGDRLDVLNAAFDNLTTIMKAASMYLANPMFKPWEVSQATIQQAVVDLDQLVAEVNLHVDGTYEVGDYRDSKPLVAQAIELMAARYNATKQFFTI